MSRRATLSVLLVLLSGFLAWQWGGPARSAGQKAGRARYVHVVIMSLKKDAPAGTRAAIIKDAHDVLADLPMVRDLRAGLPAAMGHPRAHRDYQVGMLMMFDDMTGLRDYLDHPKHRDFVERHKNAFEKVDVYDFEDEKN